MKLTAIAVPILFLAFGSFAAAEGSHIALQFGDVTARPGQSDVVVPLSIFLGPEVEPVTGWTVAVSYPYDIMGGVTIENVREADFFVVHEPGEFYDRGTIAASLVYAQDNPPGSDRYITQANQGAIADLRFCVLPAAQEGLFPIGYSNQADGPYRSLVSTTVASGGKIWTPIQMAGSILVSGPAIPGAACEEDEASEIRREPVDPAEWRATYTLGGGSAARGEELVVPFYISSNVGSPAFLTSIDFDEEVLEGISFENLFPKLDGTTDWDFCVEYFDNSNLTPGNGGVDEGFLVAAVVFEIHYHYDLPVDVQNEVLRIHFRVRPEAPLGETAVRFLDGATIPEGLPVTNLLCLDGMNFDPEEGISPSFVVSRITVLPDGALFVRGDSNGDFQVDLGDAVATLGYLFLGTSIWCREAADANDDGALDISDPLTTLGSLFLGTGDLPPPNVPGNDPTPDFLGSCSLQ